MKELIKKLVEATGPSGFENQVRDLLYEEVKEYADEIRIDALGNLIAKKGKKTAGGKTIMMSGHMDEIGLMVTHIDDNGFLRFTPIGGVNPSNCVGGRVQFLDGTLGVINLEMKGFGFKSTDLKLDSMFIDIGAASKAEVTVKVGDVACFHRPFEEMGSRLVSKAMDDRIATAILAEAIKQVKETPNELYFVFSTQEEVGLRGAKTSAYGIDPDLGIAIDVTPAVDTPKGQMNDVKLGKGPAIKVKDSSLLVDPKIINWMENAAKKLEMPVQYEVLPMGGTDAGAINLTRAGVLSGCISVPTRYVHSPSEMVDYQDVLNSVRLLVELVSKPVEF